MRAHMQQNTRGGGVASGQARPTKYKGGWGGIWSGKARQARQGQGRAGQGRAGQGRTNLSRWASAWRPGCTPAAALHQACRRGQPHKSHVHGALQQVVAGRYMLQLGTYPPYPLCPAAGDDPTRTLQTSTEDQLPSPVLHNHTYASPLSDTAER